MAIALAVNDFRSILPPPLALAEVVPADVSPVIDVEREEESREKAYDPRTQIGAFDISITSSKSSGICCSYSGGIDISSRDTTKDD